MVDWGQAFNVGVVGFVLVFFVLAMLALAMWFIGWFFNKTAGVKNPFNPGKKNKSENKTIKSKEIPEYKPKLKIDDFDRYE
jgi:Na+-transporting methylmalonyl-CoA/oxaloacetate decarboxylase gamma subunit